MLQSPHCFIRTSRLAIFVVLGLVASSLSLTEVRAAQNAIVFMQRNSSQGQVITTVAQSGIRIELPKQQCVIVGSPPEWKMTLFNAQANTKFEQTLAQLQKSPMFLVGEDALRFRAKVIQTSKTFRNDIPMTVREAATNFNLSSELWERTQIGVDRRNVRRMYFFSYEDKTKAVPEQAIQFVNALYGFPPYMGLVIGLKYRFANGQIASVIEPSSLKSCKVKPADFSVPPGLKVTKMKMEVLSAGVSNLVEDWADDMGLGEIDRKKDRAKEKNK